MPNRVFVDSNVWVYLFLQDDRKKYEIAEEFLSGGLNSTIVISYQVANEVSNVLLKHGYSEAEVRESIERLFKICALQ